MTYRLSAIAAVIAFLCMGCCCPCGAPFAAFQQVATTAAQQAAKAAAEQAQYRNDLKVLGLTFHNYIDSMGKAPANWQELIEFADPTEQQTLRDLQNKNTTVVWGVTFNQVVNGTSNTALAYNPAVAGMGGAVLMFDASVRDVGPGELNDLLYQPQGAVEVQPAEPEADANPEQFDSIELDGDPGPEKGGDPF